MSARSTPEYIHLGNGINWMDAQIARKEKIIEMMNLAKAQHPPQVLAQMGDHFKNFAPVVASEKKRLKQRLS